MQHPQKVVPYNNGTPCEKMPRTELGDFLKGIL